MSNPVSDKWARRIRAMWDWQENFRGDNVKRTNNSVYVGSSDGGQDGGSTSDWHPRQFLVKSEENDYLVCVPYNAEADTAGDRECRVAKPFDFRGGNERWGVTPAYAPDVSVIWAASFYKNGAEDADGNPIVLMDMNQDGRSASRFPAKVTGNSADGDNKWTYRLTEQDRTASGWSDLANGRSVSAVVNGAEANNSGAGVQGNGIDIDGTVFDDNTDIEIQPIQGEPVVWVDRTYDKTTGDALYSISEMNAIDGECA